MVIYTLGVLYSLLIVSFETHIRRGAENAVTGKTPVVGETSEVYN